MELGSRANMDALAQLVGLSELDLMRLITVAIAILVVVFGMKSSTSSGKKNGGSSGRVFKSSFRLNPKDQALLDMLDPLVHNYVITDPAKDDNPIIYASDHFSTFTQYPYEEIVGRNCRFLQGKDTEKKHVSAIRKAVNEENDENVTLLNYKKDGTKFTNDFFICPLHTMDDGRTVYYLGVQHEKVSGRDKAVSHTYTL